MPSQFKIAGIGATAGPTVDWVNPNNITSSNNVYATATLQPGGDVIRVSDFLRADLFNFSIPAMATIDGLVCRVEQKAGTASSIAEHTINILKNGSVPGGSDNKSTTAVWSTAEGFVSYGSPSDLWGTTWTPADINHVDTGFTIRCQYNGSYSGDVAYVDSMDMTVYYTVDGIKFGTSSIGRVYFGNTEVTAIYHGSNQIS
jgi:large repetitive protein